MVTTQAIGVDELPQALTVMTYQSQGIAVDPNVLLTERRRRQAELAAEEAHVEEADAEEAHAEEAQAEDQGRVARETSPESRKRKAEEQKAIEKIKKSKKFQSMKNRRGKRDSSEDSLALEIYKEEISRKAGQLQNCEKCGKRFTVTPYTKAGPRGGLLCPKCAKDLDGIADKPAAKKKKTPGLGHTARQKRAEMLDGVPSRGPRSLFELCLRRVADEINDVEDFGEVSPAVSRQLVMILCRRRQMNTRTITMLLTPDMDDITIWDAAELKTDDFLRVFKFCPDLKKVLFMEAGQFKDDVLKYVAEHPSIRIEKLRLVGSNLITDPVWCEFFENKGQHLKAFGTGFLDGHFGPAVMDKLVEHGARIERLKMHSVQKLTWGMTRDISKLKNLCHLTLKRPWDRVTSGTINTIIEAVGHQLQTFCLDQYQHIDDAVLEKIHDKCRQLDKLRFLENGNFTDAGFVRLFTEWGNHPLRYVAFDSCRYHNADDPVENKRGVGLCSDGFKAMMAHSGSDLQHMNVRSCRHISHAAFLDVFDGVKIYPKLETVNVAFCGAVDDTVLTGLFRSCPKIKRIWIFGCFAVTTRSPPRDVFVIGHPSADGDLAIHG